jgi:hypothetical protein
VQDLDKAVERARLLMTVSEAYNTVAVVTDSQPSVTSKLEEQVAKLTEQVAALLHT